MAGGGDSFRFGHAAVQPGSCQDPQPISSTPSQPECLGRLLVRKSCEIAEFHQTRRLRIVLFQLRERGIQCQKFNTLAWRCQQLVDQFDAMPIAAMLDRFLPPRSFHQDLPHRAGRSRKKVGAALPLPGWPGVDKAQIRFVHQPRSLNRLTGRFLRHLLGRQTAQLLVDQRQQLIGSEEVALSIRARILVTSFIGTRGL